jgi:hypothetical protein
MGSPAVQEKTISLAKGRQVQDQVKESAMPDALTVVLKSMEQVWMIVPAIFVGVISGICAAFEVGLQSALDTFHGKTKRK